MAKELVFDIKVNGLDGVNKSVSDLENNLKDVASAADDINLNSGKVKEFDNSVKGTNETLEEFDKTLQDVEKSQTKLMTTEQKAEGIAKTLSGVINISAGVFAAFGIESENAAKVMLKVQAAMAFSTGVKDLSEGFKKLGITFDGVKKIMLANPFLAIATVILTVLTATGALNGVFEILGEVVELVSEKLKKLISWLIDTAKAAAQFLGLSINIDKTSKAGIKLAEVLAELETAQNSLNKSSERSIELMKAQGAPIEEIEAAERKLLETRLKQQEQNLLIANQAKDEAIARGDSAEKIDEINKVILTNTEEYLDLYNALQINSAEVTNRITEEKEAKAEKNAEAEKKRNEDRIKNQSEAFKAIQENLKAEKDLILEGAEIETQSLKEKLLTNQITQAEYDKLIIQNQIKSNNDVADLLKSKAQEELNNINISKEDRLKLQEDLDDELRAITSKNLDLDLQIKKEADAEYLKVVQQSADDEAKIKADAEAKQKEADEKAEQDKLDRYKNLNEEITGYVSALGGIISIISENTDSLATNILNTLGAVTERIPELMSVLTDSEASITEKAQAALAFTSSAIGSIGSLLAQESENRLTELSAEEAKQIEALKNKRDRGIITEKQLTEGIAAIQKDAAKKEYALKKKAFNDAKAIQLVQAILSTAQGVIAGFTAGASLGPAGVVMGPVMAGIAAALGAVQIGIIASQKFPEGGSGGSSVPSAPNISIPEPPSASEISAFTPDTFGTNVSQEQTLGGSSSGSGVNTSIRAYVVESDVTSVQERITRIENTSKL